MRILNSFSPVIGVQSGRSYARTDLATHPYNVVQLSYTLSPIVVFSRVFSSSQTPSHRGLITGSVRFTAI